MITKKTTLVLGAGASQPFGFPTGRGLLDEVVRGLEEEGGSVMQRYGLIDSGFESSEIEEFRYELSRSGRQSVDAFLEHRPEFLDVGKAAIATFLKPAEQEWELFDPAVKGNWYEYLFQQMNASFEEFPQNRLSVVTFNYDRSLEFYLYTALKHAYGKTDEEVVEAVRGIPINHVHGHLGLLPELDGSGVPFECDEIDGALIRQAAKGIQIIHEDSERGPLEFASKLVREAEVVCFLGFGYHEANLRRIGLLDTPKVRARLFGTAKGFTSKECSNMAEAFFGGKPSVRGSGSHGAIRLSHQWQDCLELLRAETPFA